MRQIRILSQETIDQIAAGEVVERPASIVKELVENAIDAGAGAITVEIKDGGILLIRVTDNGEGIAPDQVRTAFKQHATSKLSLLSDLDTISTMGFRGEALSSICAVSRAEMITKTPGALTGVRTLISGGKEELFEEIGAPDGTTVLIRDLFFNVPARKKFLKAAQTEAGAINDLMEKLALSRPDLSFQFISNGQVRLHTSGNGRLKDIIYGIYGKETAAGLFPAEGREGEITLEGVIGKPSLSRGNRSYEMTFVNGRFIKSPVLSRALEDGFGNRLMQHRYPFAVLFLTLPGSLVDINVHPAKREVRFARPNEVYDLVQRAVASALSGKELIVRAVPGSTREEKSLAREEKKELARQMAGEPAAEPFETLRRQLLAESKSPYQPRYPARPHNSSEHAPLLRPEPFTKENEKQGQEQAQEENRVGEESLGRKESLAFEQGLSRAGRRVQEQSQVREDQPDQGPTVALETKAAPETKQLSFFSGQLLSPQSVPMHRIVGQVFDTYWIVEFQDKMFLIDQHAAHEKVLYERLQKSFRERTIISQLLSPPILLTLTMQEEDLLARHMDAFRKIGFTVESFGGREYRLVAVPDQLLGIADRELFLQMLDSLTGQQDGKNAPSTQILADRLATMACKAAVKGGNRLGKEEAAGLIRELLTLENPYTCPHGRPTIISMSRYELEKKFKRIV